MPYPKEHAARMIQPERFEPGSFRRKNIAEGVDIIMGRLKGKDSMTAQAYRFDKSKFTADQAKKWLEENNLKPLSFEEAADKIQSFVRLTSHKITAFEPSEIRAMIPADVLARIKQTDKHPLFQMYSICHDGVSNPRLIGEDAQPITWTRRAVESIKRIGTKGVKFFFGHNEDNSTDGRKAVGEVIADRQIEKDGRLHHVVIAYHYPEYRDLALECDVCSQEGEWTFFEKAGTLIANAIESLTGIAIGRAKDNQPAFDGAKRLGMIQAFEPVKAKEKNKMADGEPKPRITFETVKQAVRNMNIFPSQLYSIEEIGKDMVFGKTLQDMETIKNENNSLKKRVQEIEDEKKKIEQGVLLTSVKDRFKTILEGKKLLDLQKKFVESQFAPETVDPSDEGIGKYIDEQMKQYQRLASLFIPDGKPTKTDGTSPVKDDYNLAEKNPLLKEDIGKEE